MLLCSVKTPIPNRSNIFQLSSTSSSNIIDMIMSSSMLLVNALDGLQSRDHLAKCVNLLGINKSSKAAFLTIDLRVSISSFIFTMLLSSVLSSILLAILDVFLPSFLPFNFCASLEVSDELPANLFVSCSSANSKSFSICEIRKLI